jgi:5'-nucleotidase
MAEIAKKSLKILLANDDGYRSEAYQLLGKKLQEDGHEVFMIAPEQNNSGVSHALTLDRPVFFKKVRQGENPHGLQNFYYLSGTPVDCVKFGLTDVLRDNRPDLVISGMNYGANLATDVFYSGTVAAAFEGYLHGISSVAFSCFSFKPAFEGVEKAVEWFAGFLGLLIPFLTADLRLLNINYPDPACAEAKGVRICRLGKVGYCDSYEKRTCPSGREYHWLKGDISYDDEEADCDKIAVRDGFISVVPMRSGYDDFDAAQKLRTLLS